MAKTHWHFPRTEFAASVLAQLANGPLQGVSLFGPRRTGKTEFLRLDLAPLGQAKGHRVIYANFWQTLDSPLAILLYEFDFALRRCSLVERARVAAAGMAPKFKLRTPDGAAEMEVDLAQLKWGTPESHLLLLDQYCARFSNDKKPTLLLLDEFQELARAAAARPLIAALRTSLEKRKNGLAVVFTGSSQEHLRIMFTPKQAPFYRFAAEFDPPRLDLTFVDHQLAALHASSKVEISRADAVAVFERFGRNPLFMQRWLMTRGLNAELSAGEATERVESEVALEFGFADKWRRLTSLQRAVARALAERVAPIFGQVGGKRIAMLLNETPPPPQRTQAALRRLVRLGHADKWDTDWRLTDPLFESWIKTRPDSDF